MGTFLTLLAVLAVLAVVLFVAFSVRRSVLRRGRGTFECSLRLRNRKRGQGWVYGIARYTDDALEWHRVFSFAARPARVIARRDILVRGRRPPRGPEALSLLSGAVVLECSVNGKVTELAMSPSALTGFLSWLEAAPPGQHMVA